MSDPEPYAWTECEKANPEVQRKIESCVAQVEAAQECPPEKWGTPGCYNPFAVCRAVIKCPPNPGLKEVLEWNQKCVLGDILAIETHIVELGREQVPDAWCIKKHRVHAIQHCLSEAVNHAESLGMDAKPYRDFKAKFEALPDAPTLEQVRALRDEWRRVIRDPTLRPGCPICSMDLGDLFMEQPSLPLGEEEYADRVVTHLASCLRVAKPRVVVTDTMPEPVLGAFTHREPGTLFLKRGSVSTETVSHEFWHYYGHLNGLDETRYGLGGHEEMARQFSHAAARARSCDELKRLNTQTEHHLTRPMRGREIAGLYGAEFIAKGLERGFREIDKTVVLPLPSVLAEPSFWLNMILGFGLPLGAFVSKKVGDERLLLLTVWGAHHATTAVEYAEEAMTTVGGAAVSVRYVPPSGGVALTQGTSAGRY